MLSFKNLNIRFGSKTILRDGSFEIAAGDHVQILGPSGVGKSTILKAIIQFITTPKCEIRLDDHLLVEDHIDEYRQNFAYIGQKAPFHLGSVLDFILQPFLFKRNAELVPPTQSDIDALLTSLGFNRFDLKQAYNSLSGGEQQRVTIAQALLLKRRIYLLDEITSALDPTNTDLVISTFRKMEETTFVVVSHDSEWQAICHRQFAIEDQQIKEVKS